SKVKTFVDGLNIATSCLVGRGGVWVMNPPYLLFYPDKNRDDVPDGDPVVHLSGFGLEDTHAVASSLTWGPDGWISGSQGSTFIAYGGELFGKQYDGKIIGPHPLMSRITLTRLERDGSTFKTIEENPMMTSDDGWFRPVDLKTGPDGALYIAAFYEKRIRHVDPRDTWDRSTGRIWRIRPINSRPGKQPSDLRQSSVEGLV